MDALNAGQGWERELSKSLRSAEDLLKHGLIEKGQVEAFGDLLSRYSMAVPRYYAGLIDRKDPQCPIRKQALPHLNETGDQRGYKDPLGDLDFQPAKNITHRYEGRVLFHLTTLCSMYCRFCFRKSLLNEKKKDFLSGRYQEAMDYLEGNKSILEVIFSGGDPLMVSDQTLASVMGRLEKISHIQTVRLHSRVPVTFPARITPELVLALQNFSREKILVTHFNHPKEITPEAMDSIGNLQQNGLEVLNQTVLLKEVNDCPSVLAELFCKLHQHSIRPYYLHHPDPARGTAHFWLSLQQGWEIYKKVRAMVPGYKLPRYVVECYKEHAKIDVSEKMMDQSSKISSSYFENRPDSSISSSSASLLS